MKNTFIGRFIGPNKIKSFELLDITTPSGGAIFEFSYEDGRKELLPEKAVAVFISDEPKDFQHLFDSRINAIIPGIIDLLKEYDIPFEQFESLMVRVASQFQNHFNRANAILWFGTSEEYIPGSDTTSRLTLLMAERVNSTQKPD